MHRLKLLLLQNVFKMRENEEKQRFLILSRQGREKITERVCNEFEYTVSLKEVLPPQAVADMLAGEWDLTLFTCTTDASHRLTTRCERAEK